MSNDEEFEHEGPLGKIKAKGKGALILSGSAAVLLAGGGLYLATRNKEALQAGLKLAKDGVKLLKG